MIVLYSSCNWQYACTRALNNTSLHESILAYIHESILLGAHTQSCDLKPRHVLVTLSHTHIHTYTHAYMHTYIVSCCVCMHICIHSCIYTYIRIHTFTEPGPCMPEVFPRNSQTSVSKHQSVCACFLSQTSVSKHQSVCACFLFSFFPIFSRSLLLPPSVCLCVYVCLYVF
jgi:hypothetical protein